MNVVSIKGGFIATNTYFVINNNKAVIIDPEGKAEAVMAPLNERGIVPAAIFITHGHFDHIGAVADLKEQYKLPVYMHPADSGHIFSRRNQKKFSIDIEIHDNMKINIAGMEFKVIHTPGHSKGSVCYVAGDKIFSGDTLFYHDRGRTDLEGGSDIEMHNSLIKLFELDGEYKVFPGHDRTTTLEEERGFFGYVQNTDK